MTDTSHYRALADSLYVKAKSDPQHKVIRYAKERNQKPVDADYIPTGITKLDMLVNALPHMRVKYGSDDASNFVDAADGRDVTRDFDRDTHWIEMPYPQDFLDIAEYPATLAHELTHWGMLEDRNIPTSPPVPPAVAMIYGLPWPTPGMVIEELAAEIGAAILLDWAGVSIGESNRLDYIKDWLAHAPESHRDAAYAKAEEWAIKSFHNLLQWAGIKIEEPAYGSDA